MGHNKGMTTNRTETTYDRTTVYCTKGHVMVSGPATRAAKLIAYADEDGCGVVGCKAKRGTVTTAAQRLVRWTA